MFVADIVTEEARHGTHGPGVLVRFVDWTVEGHFAGVEADTGP
jgi:hypothetical protein